MNKLLSLFLSVFLFSSLAFAQATPTPVPTATATSTPLAAFSGDKIPPLAAAFSQPGALAVANPYQMPIPLIPGVNGSVLSVGSTGGVSWTSTPSLAGSLQFTGNFAGPANTISTLAAAGSGATDGGFISTVITRVTAADGTKGVILPPLANVSIGVPFKVINSDVTNALKVYSFAVGDLISGQAGTTAISVAAKLTLDCVKYDTLNWYCSKGVLPY